MNVWKPIALAAAAGLALSLGVQVSQAGGGAEQCYDQSNMLAARTSLRQAKASLEKAEHNKGGWRVKAIEATNTALRETEAGCKVANGEKK